MWHDSPRSGHYSVQKTFDSMKSLVWWPRMIHDIEKYTKTCLMCQYYKVKTGKAPFFPRSIPPYPFYTVSLDLVGPLITTRRGRKYILAVQDAYSKWMEFIPVNNMRAATIAKAFMEEIVAKYGPPTKILTDRGSQFLSAVFGRMCAFLGVRSVTTTAYRPQANGANERTHQELKRYLSIFMNEDGSETISRAPWDSIVRFAAWAHNTAVHSVLKMTPYEVLFNRPPTISALGALGGEFQITERILQAYESASEMPTESFTQEDKEILRMIQLDKQKAATAQEKVKKLLERAQAKWDPIRQPDKKLREFSAGQYVLLRDMTATLNSMKPRYTGPYEIEERVSSSSYRIIRPEKFFARTNYRDVVHIDRLKPFYEPRDRQIKPLYTQQDENDNNNILPPSTPLTNEVRVMEFSSAESGESTITPPIVSGKPVPVILDPSDPESEQTMQHTIALGPPPEQDAYTESQLLGIHPAVPVVNRAALLEVIPEETELEAGQPIFTPSKILTRSAARNIGYSPPDVFNLDGD